MNTSSIYRDISTISPNVKLELCEPQLNAIDRGHHCMWNRKTYEKQCETSYYGTWNHREKFGKTNDLVGLNGLNMGSSDFTMFRNGNSSDGAMGFFAAFLFQFTGGKAQCSIPRIASHLYLDGPWDFADSWLVTGD